jgi:hypothetical protein
MRSNTEKKHFTNKRRLIYLSYIEGDLVCQVSSHGKALVGARRPARLQNYACSARAGKVGDRIEARLGPPLFVFSGFNFSNSNILFRSLIYRRTPISFTPWCATLAFIPWLRVF